MSGSHRTDKGSIHIIRTAVLSKAADIRRTKSLQFRVRSIFYSKKKKIQCFFLFFFRTPNSDSRLLRLCQEQAQRASDLLSRQQDPTLIDHKRLYNKIF